MASLILAMIYIGFISLGLPDPLLGAAWPAMHTELEVPLSYMGILSMIIAFGTVISSLFTGFVARRLGTGLLTAISVLTTAAAMLGFALADSFGMLCLLAVPYGLGAGAVDAALNNYVAVHYAAKHMSWLHCFWGVGTVISPYIMGYVLTVGDGWHSGYLVIAVIQAVIAAALFFTLPYWKKQTDSAEDAGGGRRIGIGELLKTGGVPFMLIVFFCYCALEATAGLWASSYLCEYKGVHEEQAAGYASLYYMGITIGRLVCGFITEKLGDKKLIRMGLWILAAAVVLMAADRSGYFLTLAALFFMGIGSAPVYPSMMHLTPTVVGKEKSLYLVGIQMASAYLGINFMPTIFGFLSEHLWNGLFPFYLMIFTVIMIVVFERLVRCAEKNQPNNAAIASA